MKKRFTKLSFAILAIGTMSMLFTSCAKEEDADPCDTIVCVKGDCVNGTCDCDEGWSGSDCSNQITPSKIKITGIKLTRFPATDNGGGWDVSSAPDIFVEISYNGTGIFESLLYYDADYTQEYTFTINPYIELNNVTSQYTIRLYDYDDLDANDWMGGINFTPYFSTNGFPTTKTLDADGDVAFEVTYSYVW